VEEARERGYTETPLGRRRYLPELSDTRRATRSFAERQAMNAPIQGMAADIIKTAMVCAFRAGLPGAMLLQVHDELMFEVSEAEVDTLAHELRDVLEAVAELAVPITAEVKTGTSWSGTRPYPMGRERAKTHARGDAHA
jgi:DNA polymerase-1